MTARDIVAGNSTYSPDALPLLGVEPEDTFAFAECIGCGFLYAAEEPAPEFLAALYTRVISGERASVESRRPQWVAHQLALAASLLARFTDPVTILDYGCGYGTILRALNSPSVRCVGFEPSETVLASLTEQGLDASSDLEAIRKRGPYDGVILSDVLEHMPRPRQVLADCASMVRAGGWIAVSVPDFSLRRRKTVLDDLRRGACAARDLNPWEHLNYSSPGGLEAMLDEAGFAVDANSTADFGLRSGHGGVRRWGNGIKSALRLLRFSVRPRAMTTTLLGQRRSAV